MRRDFAFVLDAAVAAGDVVRAALGADKALIQGVSVFDVFEGGSFAADGKKSLAIEVILQPVAETLTDKDIETVAEKIEKVNFDKTGGDAINAAKELSAQIKQEEAAVQKAPETPAVPVAPVAPVTSAPADPATPPASAGKLP